MSSISLDRPSAFRSFVTILIVAISGSWLATAEAAPKPAAKGASSGSGPMPQIWAVGVRVVGSGVGANGSELHAFNERPSTAVALAIQAPEGSGIVEIDDDNSRVDAFTDNKGQNILEEGRFGSFPKISEDRAAGLVEVEVRGRPSAGASSVKVQGSVAMSVSAGTKPTRIANVRLEAGRTMKIGNVTITLKGVTPGEESTSLDLALPRSFMNTIHSVRFYDSKGELIESRRTSIGYMNDAGEMSFDVKGKEKVVSAEFDVWQGIRQIKAPFNLTVGMGLGDGAPAGATAAAAAPAAAPASASVPRNDVPKIAPAPNEGAASVEAAVSQLNTAFVGGKGRDLLAVIFPDDRTNFAMVLATGVVFSTLSNMEDVKATEKAQKEVDALIAKHKLNMPLNKPPAEIFKNSDLPAFVTDAVAYLKTHMPKGQDASAMFLPKGRPENVKIEGNSADAKVGGKDMQFARVNNKWFIRLIE